MCVCRERERVTYAEEDTCMSYEEEDTHRRQDAMIYTVVCHMRRRIPAWHRRRRIQVGSKIR